AAVLHLLRPNFEISVFGNALAFASESVLIDGDYFFVGENVVNLRTHIAQVIAGDERSGQNRPQTEVRAILGVGHSAVAYLEHVWIVPMPRPGIGLKSNLLIEDG